MKTMPAFKAVFLFMLVLLSSSCARHLEKTDVVGTDVLSSKTQQKREEDKTKVESKDSRNEHLRDVQPDLERRMLGSSGKRQDDMPGLWGRSVEPLEQSPDQLEKAFQKAQEIFGPKQVEEALNENDDKAIEGIERPGLWGRETGEESEESDEEDEDYAPRPPGLWGREVENRPLVNKNRPPGLWGREIENRPPGLWGREIQNRPPGLWGREIQIRPPGLWGREIQIRPPGLWGREIQNRPPGLWGRGIISAPQRIWDREMRNSSPRLWERTLLGLDNEEDADTDIDDKQ